MLFDPDILYLLNITAFPASPRIENQNRIIGFFRLPDDSRFLQFAFPLRRGKNPAGFSCPFSEQKRQKPAPCGFDRIFFPAVFLGKINCVTDRFLFDAQNLRKSGKSSFCALLEFCAASCEIFGNGTDFRAPPAFPEKHDFFARNDFRRRRNNTEPVSFSFQVKIKEADHRPLKFRRVGMGGIECKRRYLFGNAERRVNLLRLGIGARRLGHMECMVDVMERIADHERIRSREQAGWIPRRS